MKIIGRRTISLLILAIFIAFIRNSFAAQEPKAEIPLRPALEYDADGYRDPFLRDERGERGVSGIEEKKLAAKTVSLASLNIQGVIWGGVFPGAIINNKVVKIGDNIEGMQITQINKDGVTLSYGNGLHTIPSPAFASKQDKEEGGHHEE